MPRRTPLAPLVLFATLAVGCGARTGLPSDLDASVAPPPPPENACTSALDPGATAPERGYCSTHAHLAPHPAPSAPRMGWQVMLPTDFQPIELAVDAVGRTYATVDPVRGDDALIPHSLVIVDAHGAIVAMHDFRPDSVGGLYIARDGALHATVGVSPRRLVRIDAHATPTVIATLPDHVLHFAVASDGSLVAARIDFRSPDYVSRIAEDGTVLWSAPPLACTSCLDDLALWPDDRVVYTAMEIAPGSTSSGHTVVHALTPDGTPAWEVRLEGLVTEGPSIAQDGTVRLVTGVTDAAGATTTLVTSLHDDGTIAWQTRLLEDYQQTWDDALPVAPDGTVFVHTFHALTAVGPLGGVRWRIDTPTNLSYDAVVDAHGTLAAMLGPVRGLDAETGTERWHVDGPGPDGGTFFYISNLALAPHCLVGASHGGTLFSACDP